MSTFSLNQPLKSRLGTGQSSLFKYICLTIIGTLFLAVSAQISIPMLPVPLTFQSAAVIMMGLLYGPILGAAVVISYLVSGLSGLPVFANLSFGLPHLLSPTGGYLIGFLPAAMLSGYLAQQGWGNRMWTSFIAACLGALVIFACGASWLAAFIGWHKAYLLGIVPFALSEPLKLLVASFISSKCWKKA